jgi:hypothetical protein
VAPEGMDSGGMVEGRAGGGVLAQLSSPQHPLHLDLHADLLDYSAYIAPCSFSHFLTHVRLGCRLHSLAESFSQPRVPPGLPFMSVATRLSTVQVVFMQRFLNEFLAYLAGEGARGGGAWASGGRETLERSPGWQGRAGSRKVPLSGGVWQVLEGVDCGMGQRGRKPGVSRVSRVGRLPFCMGMGICCRVLMPCEIVPFQ